MTDLELDPEAFVELVGAAPVVDECVHILKTHKLAPWAHANRVLLDWVREHGLPLEQGYRLADYIAEQAHARRKYRVRDAHRTYFVRAESDEQAWGIVNEMALGSGTVALDKMYHGSWTEVTRDLQCA